MLHDDEYVVNNDVHHFNIMYGDTYVRAHNNETCIRVNEMLFQSFCLFCIHHLRYLDSYMDLCLGLPCVHSSISINDSCHDVQNHIVCTLRHHCVNMYD